MDDDCLYQYLASFSNYDNIKSWRITHQRVKILTVQNSLVTSIYIQNYATAWFEALVEPHKAK